ncbi:MAG TPA: T9SS type A sorting domain-containing protein [Flavobacteriales bacterium]|nr:T9SS type A sorting domain-containing protein [Flavobacteriales bacterium]
MRLPLLLSCTLIGAAASTAQTLTSPTNNMVPGDVFIVQNGTGPAPGHTGSANWNYSSLTVVGEPYTENCETPSSSVYAAYFPTATVRVGDSFMRCDATGLYFLGWGALHPLILDDPWHQFAFPCSYNTTWTDTFSGTDGMGYTTSGTTTGLADATGALVMPYGTIPNVLRLRVATTNTINDNGNISTDENVLYFYMKPGVHYPVVIANEDHTYVDWLDQASVGVDELLAHSIGVDVFPNPAADAADVVYSATGERLQLTVVDIAGAVVMERTLTASVGIQREHLDVSSLAKGLYTIRITNANGGQGMRRLVVQ